MSFYKVCEVDAIWNGEKRLFVIEGRSLLVLRQGQEYRVYDDRCPHQGVSLFDGFLDGCVLTCAAHCWQFDTTEGRGLNPTDACLLRYPTKIENGQIFVDLPDKQPRPKEIHGGKTSPTNSPAADFG